MKTAKRFVFIILITYLMVITCITYAESITNPVYDISDYIPKEAQAKAIAHLIEDSGIINSETTSRAYNNILTTYLSYYGIVTDKTDGNVLADWLQTVLTKKGTVQYLPDNLTQQQAICDYLAENADPGDILFYRINGMADKCLVCLENGKTITVQNGKYRRTDVPSTFVDGDTLRTSSSGIFAYAHLWKTKEESPIKSINIVLSKGRTEFTGESYSLYVRKSGSEYFKCPDYIVIEREPGIYDLWDGNSFGINLVKWDYEQSIILELQSSNNSGIPKRIKVNIENAFTKDDEFLIDLSV